MTDSSLAPDDAVLRRFLLGQLAGAERERVAAYLDKHPEVLEVLNAGNTLSAAPESGDATVTAPKPPSPSYAETADPDDDPEADVRRMLDASDQPGDLGRLGRYRVLRVLGRGGMGVVYEAEDDKLRRKVALKAMLPALAANASARKRFVREAEAAAKVEHDNIVPIYDIADANGVPFLAMPLLIGETLDDRLKPRAPLPVPDVLTIGRHIAEGLAAAHAAGLIHRDIKPSNVWLERTPAGAFKRARILDFGLARSVRDGGGGLTQSGAVMGTPAYMAPEQARGEKVDHRADLFSLGCVLYQMVTGQRPFTGESILAVLTSLATDTPTSATSLNPGMPEALSALIDRLLSKNPADRLPPTAQDVADELARIATEPHAAFSGSLPVVLPVPSRPEEVWSAVTAPAIEADDVPLATAAESPKSRRRFAFAALAVLLGTLGLVAAAIYTTRERTPEPPTGDTTTTPRVPPGEPKKRNDPKLAGPAGVIDANRTAAERLLAAGWRVVIINPTEKRREFFRTGDRLPPGPLAIDWVNPTRRDLGTDALAPLSDLTDFGGYLDLEDLAVSDQVLARLTAAPGLARVRSLDLARTGTSDAGLAHLKTFRELTTLTVRGNPKVGDAGLTTLAGVGALTRLDARETGVTKIGVEKLAVVRPDLRIEFDGGTIEPTAGYPIDVLALVDVKRDAFSGRWKMREGTLVGGGDTVAKAHTEKLQVRYVPPAEYDLVMRVERYAVASSNEPHWTPSFSIILTGAGRCQAVFDWREGELGATFVHGLQLVDGKPFLTNPTRTEGDFFGPKGGPVVITCRMRKNEVTVLTDGQVHFRWKGDVSKLESDEGFWKVPDKTQLAVAVQNAEYGISEWKVYPVEASPEAGAPTTEQRKALEWARDAGATLLLRAGDQFVTVTKGTPLPAGAFAVTRIAFDNVKGLDDAAVENLKHLPSGTFALSLRGSRIENAGFAKLAAYPWAPGVNFLDISDTVLTDAGYAHLERFVGVVFLIAEGSRATGDGLKHLRPLPNLVTLILTNSPKLTGADLAALAGLKLTNLQLSNCPGLTDAGLVHLAKLPTLQLLDLQNVPLTDEAVPHLAACLALVKLDLKGTKVTKAGAEKLAKELPNCRIEYDGGVIEPKAKLDDAMPPDNAFPGEVILREPFDKATDNTPVVDNGQHKSRFVNGVYEGRWFANVERPAGMGHEFGPSCADTAFALRVRAHALGYITYFRPVGDADQYTLLGFGVRPDGTWDLIRATVKRRGEGWEMEWVTLNEAAAPDADLKEGKWVTLTVRSAGATTEVWVNGRPLVTFAEPKPPADKPVATRGAVVFATKKPDKVACGFDLDYLVIWKLPAPGAAVPKK